MAGADKTAKMWSLANPNSPCQVVARVSFHSFVGPSAIHSMRCNWPPHHRCKPFHLFFFNVLTKLCFSFTFSVIAARRGNQGSALAS
jgi:hypothetical protein